MRRRQRSVVVGALVIVAACLASLGKQVDPPTTGPNVIVITTDDMRLDDLQYMPNTLRLLADEGVTFSQMLSPYPLCCPARAQLLTGQYSHNNEVQGNAWPRGGYYKLDGTNTLPVWLHDGGYETAFMGKYLNEYGERDEYEIPPGWDYWMGSVAGIHDYHRVTTSQGGRIVTHSGVYRPTSSTPARPTLSTCTPTATGRSSCGRPTSPPHRVHRADGAGRGSPPLLGATGLLTATSGSSTTWRSPTTRPSTKLT